MNNYRMNITIWEDFQEQFPSMSRDVIDYYRSGRFEITVIFSDRKKAYYNYFNKTIRFINPRSDSGYEDEAWRHNFAIALNDRLNRLQMTQKDLASSIGVSPMTIIKYIRGTSSPSAYMVLKISHVLDCSVSELIDFDF